MGTRSDLKVSDVESKVGEKKKRRLFGPRDVPININFPNEKGIPDDLYDPDIPVEEILKDAPRLLKKQAELLKEELSSTEITFEKKELVEDMVGVRHNEARVEWRFDTPEALSKWNTGCDSDWKEGYSTVQFVPTDNNTALFKGQDFVTECERDASRCELACASISLGIVLMDRIDGEFQLELDYIGVYNDQTHFEKFAYETYTLPIWNTHGF
ncbi:hypothetical protein OSTOST_10124 [Ostertagia ostertagi]